MPNSRASSSAVAAADLQPARRVEARPEREDVAEPAGQVGHLGVDERSLRVPGGHKVGDYEARCPGATRAGHPRGHLLRAVHARGGCRRAVWWCCTVPARRRRATSTSAACAATAGWRRWPTTPAATGARPGSSGPRPSATCWRCATCCARTPRAWRCADRAWVGGRPSTRRRWTTRSRRSWRSARRPRRSCCAACAPGRSRASGTTPRRWTRGCPRWTCTPPPLSSAPRAALLLLHARGDEQIPYTVSEELHRVAQDPKRLVLFPGGHHRSLQHDLEVQNLAVRFIERAFSSH